VLVVLVVAALAAGAFALFHHGRTPYERALDTLPRETLRATYTDWAQVRAAVHEPSLDRFIEDAYDRDLTQTSALESTADQLQKLYAIDLRAAQWEVYGQSDQGSVAVLAVGDSTSYGRVRAALRHLGYAEPSSDTDAWGGSPELIAGIDPDLTPALQNVLLLEKQRLVLFSDSATYAEQAADVVDGSADSFRPEVSELAGEVTDPVSAYVWAADRACTDLSMSSADSSDQDQARALVDKEGGVNPLDGLLMAHDTQGRITVAMQFENDAQAKENLQPRTDLAAGEAPGLAQPFSDLFTIRSSVTDGRLVVMHLTPRPDQDALLSTLSDGPLLFATC
jgi:hypothetical protein